MFTGFSSFKTLISPPTQEWKTQSLYCCTCATLYTHTACVTSLQFPTMSHNISYLKFTGAYVWVCPMGKNSAIVEEQETAETGPTKHRQLTRQEWGGGLTHFVFQFHWAWPPRHRLATHTHTGLRIVVDRGSSGSFFCFFLRRGRMKKLTPPPAALSSNLVFSLYLISLYPTTIHQSLCPLLSLVVHLPNSNGKITQWCERKK